MQFSINTTILISLLLRLAVAQSMGPTTTESTTPQPTLVVSSGLQGYAYLGCYNETLDTTNQRAVYGGNVTTATDMTVQKCLGICNSMGFEYAGLEYTSECYCGPYLSELSQKLADSDCNFGCAGNNSEACGGALRVTVYKLGKSGSANPIMSPSVLVAVIFACLVSWFVTLL
ncbi:hypothetical protein TWF694_010652 [Orbilia ellipsospora]|uniref:WSC domain-containing protein n=1 Tax=Orbilia ellipsospora TaxID=2528407 RepID=A0AAV9XAL6_9PEZI